MMKSYAIHSLFTAYVHCRYGIPQGEQLTGIHPNATLRINLNLVIPKLLELANAHEEQDEQGRHKEYVKACMSSTTKTAQRITRFKVLCDVLVS